MEIEYGDEPISRCGPADNIQEFHSLIRIVGYVTQSIGS